MILPGYTHMQAPQPILAPHYFLAYVEKLDRDRGRLVDCRKRLNVLPLGAVCWPGQASPSTARSRPASWVSTEWRPTA